MNLHHAFFPKSRFIRAGAAVLVVLLILAAAIHAPHTLFFLLKWLGIALAAIIILAIIGVIAIASFLAGFDSDGRSMSEGRFKQIRRGDWRLFIENGRGAREIGPSDNQRFAMTGAYPTAAESLITSFSAETRRLMEETGASGHRRINFRGWMEF